MRRRKYEPFLDDGSVRDKFRHVWWTVHQPWMIDARGLVVLAVVVLVLAAGFGHVLFSGLGWLLAGCGALFAFAFVVGYVTIGARWIANKTSRRRQ